MNTHYKNLPMQYTEIFSEAKIENFIGKFFIFSIFFSQNVLMSTHNLCFGSKQTKIGIDI